MTYEQQTIARCTRGNHVQWQQVATQLGISVETARSRHEGCVALVVRPAPPVETVEVQRRPALRIRIVEALADGPLSSSTLADTVGASLPVVRERLSAMRQAGSLVYTGGKHAVWQLPGQPAPKMPPLPAGLASMPTRAKTILRKTAEAQGVSEAIIVGRSQKHVAARYALYVALHEAGFSLSQIGRWLDQHHTTVLRAVKLHSAAQQVAA